MKNKKILNAIIIVIISLNCSLYGQQDEPNTLFSKRDISFGGYGAFEIKGSQLNNGFGAFLGGRGGVIINNMFSIGGAGYGLMPTMKVNCPIPEHKHGTSNNYLIAGYGGLFLEYINSSNSLLHFTVNTLIAAGGVTYESNDGICDRYDDMHPKSAVFIIEPGATAELNVSKFFRLSLGVSYRYSPNFELKYTDIDNSTVEVLSKDAFNGVNLNLAFKFGYFGRKKTNSDFLKQN